MSPSRPVYECSKVNRSGTGFSGAARRTVEAMEACVSPLSLIRTIYDILTVFLLPKVHHRAHAAVAGKVNLRIVLH
jgi:hypothetical protein